MSQDWIYNSHNDENYPVAFAIVAAGSVAMSGLEYYYTTARPKLKKVVRTSLRQLARSLPIRDLKRSIKKGTKEWIKWLTHRGLPPIDLSLVHDEQNVIKQAVVLSIPYWDRSDRRIFGIPVWNPKNRLPKRITRHITFQTFAAHWIDDHFDALKRYCPNNTLQEHILLSLPEDILTNVQPRLRELVKRMEKLADPRHKEQVHRAVVRIIYGGLIQNAPTEERLAELLQRYVEFISEALHEPLKSTYAHIAASDHPLCLWVTSKVVMELLDSSAPAFSVDVAEFYNLLYGPILYFEDLEEEIKMEHFGAAFGASPIEIKDRLPSLSQMLSLVDTCSMIAPQILAHGMLPPGRQRQLTTLLTLYSNHLAPELITSYARFLNV